MPISKPSAVEQTAVRQPKNEPKGEKPILVSEIFRTIQGEGALVGRPTVFVRTGGCDYACDWCDTLYAVLPQHRAEWTPLNATEILDRVFALSGGHPVLITLSGGNPALQPLGPLLELGGARGCTFALETQGSVVRSWFSQLDYLVLSPKPPSAGMMERREIIAECLQAAGRKPQVSLKVVVFDEADYGFARAMRARFPSVPFYLQPGNHTPDQGAGEAIDVGGITCRLEWLIERAGRDGWHDVTILPQLHTLLWGNKRGI